MTKHALADLKVIISGEGIDAGIGFLNRRVLYRFTAIYQLRSQTLYRTHLADKMASAPQPDLYAVRYNESYCHHAASLGQFVTNDATLDRRLDGNRYQHIIQSYAGFPILNRAGQLAGTFCHLDIVPRDISDEELNFLRHATFLLADALAWEDGLAPASPG